MMSTLYVGATGLKTHGFGLNTISNNLANVNTVGYKQQSALFQDLMSQDLPTGSAFGVAVNQRGLGSQLGDVRTLFTQGSFEPGSEVTDLAIGGKGFFQVTDGEDVRYTRAGNFRFGADGVLRDPAGYTLTGLSMQEGQLTNKLVPIQLNPADATLMKNPPKASNSLTTVMNIGSTDDVNENAANPYFSLLSSWNGAANAAAGQTPLMSGSYSTVQPMKVYDSTGRPQTLNIYIDGAPSTTGQRTVEYLVAADPAAMTGPDGTPGRGTGALMSGTLTFSSSGQLLDMTAFVPTGGDPANLASWTPAPLVNGVPQFSVGFAGAAPQPITLDLGIKSASGAWAQTPVANAAQVGALAGNLPSMGAVERASSSSTAYNGASSIKNYKQDGHAEGDLADVEITEDGVVRARYTNSQTAELFTIPLFRFTSEDGLRREGNNHYSAPDEAGTAEWGLAKTSNYGFISSRRLETSNVDMSREMANLIIMQRGFQMNSKSINTADTMLQKAMEIKR